MHIYEVMKSEGLRFGSHLVVAKNEENAKRIVADMLNVTQTAVFYKASDFVANGPIDPNNYPEGTVIF
ncbi:hypothetical protein LMB39_11315 [Limosilactobacillus reuteri]|uniref:hypothetical protein n=1 Tax=Limosilactobacillus reuteri TaxID=1598 RepID=UPI001E52D231|nr:hypothetical protein [Limosilactobacillus reuteri]MCC4346987.1 hypothetical protein [Limosilactobacillus reuteri]MCC4373954.1 hypothetical protein [Limosilactobacillus reuteri]MCC4386482.1 hypothetical protein [Limosilactobacillus reuteri]